MPTYLNTCDMWLLIRIKLAALKNKLSRLTFVDELKLIGAVFLSIAFLAILYFGSYRLLFYINTLELIGSLLVLKLLSLAFLTTFVMVILSSIIVSFSTIYLSQDLPFLLSLPIKYHKIYLVKIFETVFYSSWNVLVALIPFIIAFGNVKNVPLLGFYSITSTLLLPFLFIASSVGILLSLFIMYLFPSAKTRDVVLVVVILLGAVGYILFRFLEPEKLANPDIFKEAMHYLAYLTVPTAKYLPSWWITGAINSFLNKHWLEFGTYSAILFLCAIVLYVVFVLLSKKLYYRGLTQVHTGTHSNKRDIIVSKVYYPFLFKDIKIFFRETRQWSQIMLLFALSIVYLFSIYKLPVGEYYSRNFVCFLNIGATAFIIAAINLRFIFTSISLEGGTFWLVLSSPVSMKKLLIYKLLLFGLPVVILGSSFAIIVNYILKVDIIIFWLSLITIVIVSIGLCCLALGLGSMFPRFNAENIQQIETSSGGLFYMALSLVYIGLILGIGAAPLRDYIRYGIVSSLAVFRRSVIDFVIVNIVAIFLPLWLGKRYLERYELREWTE